MISFNRRNAVAFSFICCLCAVGSFAQQQIYSLHNLTTAAIKHYPLLQQDIAKVKAAQAIVVDTRHSYLPNMGVYEQLNIGTDNSIAGAYLPISVVPSVSGGIRNDNVSNLATGNVATFYSQYEVWNFGLKKAKINNASSLVGIERASLQQDEYNIKLETANLYFNLIKSIYQKNEDADNVSRYEQIYQVIEALVKSGLKPGSDTSLTKAELSKAKTNFNISAGNVQSVKQQLSYLTGMDTTEIVVDTSALDDFKVQVDNYAFPADLFQHPFVDYINQQKKFYTSYDDVIRKSYMPKVFLAGSVWARGSSILYNDNFESLGEGIGLQRFNYMAGVSVTYDLFNNIRKKDKLNINHYQSQAVDMQLQQERLYLQNNFIQANNSIKTAESNILELPTQIVSAIDVLDQKIAQYKAGLINLIDVTNAAFVLYRSKTDFIETLTNWYVARMQKAAAAGILDEFINSIK